MTRAEKKRQYNEFLQDILTRSDILDGQAITGIIKLIEDMQERILGRIGGTLSSGNAFRTDGEGRLTDWGLYWIPRLIRSIDDIVRKVSIEAGEVLGSYLAQSWELGADLVDGTIQAIEPEVSISSPRLDRIALTTLAPFSAQLITRIDEETREQLNRAIRRNIGLGESPSVLMKELQTKLDGKPSPFKSVAYRAELITRTEVARAQTLGREARMQSFAAEFPDLFQGEERFQYKFISVQRGPYPCKICRPLDGKVWDIDDSDKPQLPLHPNCFPGFVKAAPLGELEAVFRRPYEGPMVEVFVGGVEEPRLTVTPNHPILTQRGWVPAGELNERDYLVRYCGAEPDSSSSDQSLSEAYVNNPETSFEEIFSSLSVSNLVERIIDRPTHFHGDGHTEEVEIVRADRHLSDSSDSGIFEPLPESELVLSNPLSRSFASGSTFGHGFDGVATSGKSLPLLKCKPLHSESVCLGAISTPDSGFSDSGRNHPARYIEPIRNFKLRNPFGVKADDLGVQVKIIAANLHSIRREHLVDGPRPNLEPVGNLGKTGSRVIHENDLGGNFLVGQPSLQISSLSDRSLDSEFRNEPVDGSVRVSEKNSDISERMAVQISFLDVVKVNIFNFSGQVYNLQTSLGYYTTSYGIITKNCRCTLSPVLRGLNSTTPTPKPTAKRQAAASLSECVCCH